MADEKKPMHVDKVAAIYAQQGVDATVDVNKDGYAGVNPHLRARIGETPFYADAGLQVSKEGHVNNVTPAVNYVGNVTNVGGVDVLPVARAQLAIPTQKDAEFGAENAAVVGGVIVSPNGSKLDLTLAGVTDLAAKDPAFYGRLSGTPYKDENVEVTPFASATYGTKSGTTNLTQGLRTDHDFGDGTGVYAQVAVSEKIPEHGKTEVTGQATVGFTFGGEKKESSARESSQEVAQQHPLEGLNPYQQQIVKNQIDQNANKQLEQVSETQR